MTISRGTISAICLILIWPVKAEADFRLNFDRDNNTYNWITSLNYTMTKNQNRFRTYFDGNSNLIKGGFNRWQENATTGFDSQVFLRKRMALVLNGEYTVNGLDKRRVRTTELALGIMLKPTSFLRLRPILRAANKKRSELEAQLDEKGMGFGIQGELIPSVVKGIAFGGTMSYNRVNLSNIPWQEGNGAFSAVAGYKNIDSISVSLRGLEATKKYYPVSGDINEITSQIKQEREAVFGVKLRLPGQFGLRFDGGAHLSRYLYRQSQPDLTAKTQRDNYERGGDYQISFLGGLGDMSRFSVGYLWNTKNEDFQGVELDLETEKGEISFHGTAALSDRDSLSADILFGVTSYSNPNGNYTIENRDQKAIVVNGEISHRFNEYFSLGLTGGANSFHQIYMSGARSANNNQNDTYILTPYVIWNPLDDIMVKQSFDIQANYITFDFDRRKVGTKNRIFRRATTRTDLTYTISERLELSQGYLYRYEDYGLLIWDDGWQQAVSWDRRRNGLETRIVYRPFRAIRLTPYFFWEKTGDYYRTIDPDSDIQDPTEIRYLKEEQVKMFFDFEIALFWSSNRNIVADFSHRLRKFMSRPREKNDYIKISMEYLF